MSGKRASGRKPLPGFGVKGYLGKRGRYVRGFLERLGATALVRVQWRERGRRRTESWPDTPESRALAIAFGEGVNDRLAQLERGQPVTEYQPLTVREVWEKYWTAISEDTRGTTHRNYRARWMKWEAFAGREKLAHTVTREDLDAYRKALRTIGHAINQVQKHVEAVVRVFRWAVERDLVPPTKVTLYRVKLRRGEGPIDIPEYAPAEARAILGVLEEAPRHAREWRTYVALYLFAFAGPRQNAARHLRWDDVDFTAGTVRWRPEHDKLGYDRVQPLAPQVLEALWVAYGWRLAAGYSGPYVLFRPGAGVRELGNGGAKSARQAQRSAAKPDQPWSYAAFNARLREAEIAAGVPHLKYRAAHGFRRYVVGTVLEQTGNLVLAGQYVGDRDVRTLRKSYVKDRPEQLAGVAAGLGEALAGIVAPKAMCNRTATKAENTNAPHDGGASQVLPTPADTEL